MIETSRRERIPPVMAPTSLALLFPFDLLSSGLHVNSLSCRKTETGNVVFVPFPAHSGSLRQMFKNAGTHWTSQSHLHGFPDSETWLDALKLSWNLSDNVSRRLFCMENDRIKHPSKVFSSMKRMELFDKSTVSEKDNKKHFR